MEEPKRVQFTTIDNNQKDDKKPSPRKTVRFKLDLPATTDTTCPEFSFNELLKNVSGDEKTPEDPFGDDDDDDRLAAIAKSFEEKYKPKMGKKKKNKDYLEDLVDLGDGYDENDTFIDNSEAYDEVVPAMLTTKLGGFYINSGKLDFREISDDSDNDFQPQPGSAVKKKQKKRRISSDDESGQENKKVVKKKKTKEILAVDGEVKKKKKKKLILSDGEKLAKKPKLTQDKDKTKSNKSSTVSALLKSTSPQKNGENLQNGMLSPIDIDDSDDSVSKAIDSVVSGRDDSNSQAEFEDTKKEIDPEKIPKLPTSLSAELEKTIESLKNSAKESGEGKLKFFTGNVNKWLLDVELASLQMSCANRSSMYAHLAAYLPCSKETLLKRAKTLRVKEMDDKIKGPLEKLKDAVNSAMPALQEKYAADLKAAQEKASQEKSEENKEVQGQESPIEKEKAEDSDNEEGKTGQTDPAKKKFIVPPKRFVWDATTRSLLCDVVRVKMEMYEVSKVRAQTVDEYLRMFLEKEVRPVWPKGWMQQRILIKESRPAHMKWTSGQKPKKNVLVTKTPGSAPAVSHVTKIANQGSAPAAMASSKVNLLSSSKQTPLATDSAKTVVNINTQNTPTVSVNRKMIPTLLDYANNKADRSNDNALPNSANNSNSGINSDSVKSVLANSLTSKVIGPKPSQSKPLAESWDHQVADILKQSIAHQIASNKPGTQTPFQRQNSRENSYLAQFQNFTASAGAFQQSGNKLPSPKGQAQGQQQKAGHNPAIDLSPPKTHGQGQGQIMTKEQQEQFLKETQEKNIQRLLQQQMEKKKKAAVLEANKLINLAKNSSRNPETNSVTLNLVKNVAKPVQSQGAGLASKPSVAGQHQMSQNVSLLTENVIRQQLDKHAATVPSSASTSGGQMPNIATNVFKQQSALADQLRKTSPQSTALSANISMSQGKPQVVRIPKGQGQVQGHSAVSSSSELLAASLMQSLIGQAQSKSNQSKPFTGISPSSSKQPAPAPFQGASSHNAHNQPRSHLQQSSSSSPVTQSMTPKWNSTSMSMAGYNGAGDSQRRTSFDGSGDGSSKNYLVSSTSPHTVAGYQTVNLSNLSSEQMAALQHHTGIPAQPHRSPESGRYGNQMVPHTSAGAHPTHLSPHKQQRSSLNYGYPYPDNRP